MNREQRQAAIYLAAQALSAARIGAWPQAGRLVAELHETYDGGIQLLLLGLADTLLTHQGGHRPPDADADAVAVPVWVDINSGEVSPVDEVPPPVRWAGRFIAARAAFDEAACAALVNSISNDEEFTDNVCAVLDVVATSLNKMTGKPYGNPRSETR